MEMCSVRYVCRLLYVSVRAIVWARQSDLYACAKND